MNYLRIEEDGELSQVVGKDPTEDNDLLEELEGQILQVVRHHGNAFEYLEITDVCDGPEEDDPREFQTKWTVIKVAI